MARPAKKFNLNSNQLTYLIGIRDNELSDPVVCQRANALLALNDGIEINRIASSLGVTKYTIYNWRDNFLAEGISSLQNAAKSGRGGQDTQNVRQQIEDYISSCSEADLQSVTANSLAEKFHVSRYIANSILKQHNITGERQRVWNVGLTDSPIPKNTDILGMYLSAQSAIMIIATSSVGSLPLMNGFVRTERKPVAVAICDRQACTATALTVAELLQIATAFLGKNDATHRYMTCNDFFDEIMVKRLYGEHIEYTILAYSNQPIQSNALSQTLVPVQTKMYPSFEAWTEGVSTMFCTLDRRRMQNKPSDFYDSLKCYQKLATTRDEPFIWMKQPMSIHSQSVEKRPDNPDASSQTLTTVYILRSANGNTFTCTFEHNVDIPEIEAFDLESDRFYQDFEALEKAIIETEGDSLQFAKQYLESCSDWKIAAGANLTERKIDAEIGQLPVKIGGSLLSSDEFLYPAGDALTTN